MTSKDIKRAMKDANLSAADLVQLTGISNSTLSLILHDKIKISDKMRAKIETVLPKSQNDPDFETEKLTWRDFTKNIPVAVAAEAMGKSVVYVREAIKQGLLPIGSAEKHGQKWSFHISPKLFAEYMGE